MKSFAFFFLLLFSAAVQAEELFVLKVSGEVWLVSESRLLKTGEKLDDGQELRFGSSDALAVVISRQKGRFVLKAGVKKEGSNNEFISLVRDILIPQKSTVKVSTRADKVNSLEELTTLFDGKNLLLLEQRNIRFNEAALQVDGKHFFYLRFDHEGETINKKLSFQEGEFEMIREEILKIDGKPFSAEGFPEVTLFYFDASQKKSLPVATFQLLTPEVEKVKAEVEVLKSVFSEEEIKQQVNDYLLANYGQFDQEELKLFGM